MPLGLTKRHVPLFLLALCVAGVQWIGRKIREGYEAISEAAQAIADDDRD